MFSCEKASHHLNGRILYLLILILVKLSYISFHSGGITYIFQKTITSNLSAARMADLLIHTTVTCSMSVMRMEDISRLGSV